MDDPALTISGVAERTGVPQATLRAWQKRYGLAPSRVTQGGHRRYTAADLARIQSVQVLVARGASPGEAARSVLAAHPEETAQLDLPAGAEHGAHLLAAAALDLDGPRARAVMREHLARHGVLNTWEVVVRPVLVAVGEQWPDVPHGIAVEHLVSHLATLTLGEFARRRPSAEDRTVLLACMPGELHDLPLTALAAALDVTRVCPVVLGARTPVAALIEAVRVRRPAVVVLLTLLPDWAWGGIFDELPDDVVRVAAGPGWDPDLLPDGVRHVDGLLAATSLVTALA